MAYALDGDILGLDLGTVRTGVARIHTVAQIAEPLAPIQMSEAFTSDVKKLVADYKPSAVVVGMPRGLDAQTTTQTLWVQEVYKSLQDSLPVPVFTIDEAGTTKQAQTQATSGQSVDSVAACIFLEDFVRAASRGGIEDVSL